MPKGRIALVGEQVDDVIVLGRDDVGVVAESHSMRYYLTECCGASAKGSVAGGQPATVCRSCYTEVDPALGGTPDRVRFSAGRIVVEPRLALVETFGDGIPYDKWKATR